jgi:deoxyribose-phosphate aldolase
MDGLRLSLLFLFTILLICLVVYFPHGQAEWDRRLKELPHKISGWSCEVSCHYHVDEVL